jgi:hypothetical protein
MVIRLTRQGIGAMSHPRPLAAAPSGMPDRTTPPSPSDEAGPLAGTPSAPPRPEEIRRAGPLLLLGFAGLVGCAFGLAVVVSAIRRSETSALDTLGNAFIHRFQSPGMDIVMNAATRSDGISASPRSRPSERSSSFARSETERRCSSRSRSGAASC